MRDALQRLKDRDGIRETDAIRRAIEDFLKARKIEIRVAKGVKRATKK
jgi:hypothetical protein